MKGIIVGKPALSAALLLAAAVASPAQAATVTFNYTESFGLVPPVGPSPYATSTLVDTNTDEVTLTMSVAATVGDAAVTGMYFNLFDDSQATLDGLTFAYDMGASTGPEAVVSATTDFFRPDGDGFYDILFDFPPPPGPPAFGAGLTVVYTITGTGLDTSDFNLFGTPGPGQGNPGPFLSVARFQGQQGGDWVGAVPVPAAVWLFGSGLLGLVGVARRKRN